MSELVVGSQEVDKHLASVDVYTDTSSPQPNFGDASLTISGEGDVSLSGRKLTPRSQGKTLALMSFISPGASNIAGTSGSQSPLVNRDGTVIAQGSRTPVQGGRSPSPLVTSTPVKSKGARSPHTPSRTASDPQLTVRLTRLTEARTGSSSPSQTAARVRELRREGTEGMTLRHSPRKIASEPAKSTASERDAPGKDSSSAAAPSPIKSPERSSRIDPRLLPAPDASLRDTRADPTGEGQPDPLTEREPEDERVEVEAGNTSATDEVEIVPISSERLTVLFENKWLAVFGKTEFVDINLSLKIRNQRVIKDPSLLKETVGHCITAFNGVYSALGAVHPRIALAIFEEIDFNNDLWLRVRRQLLMGYSQLHIDDFTALETAMKQRMNPSPREEPQTEAETDTEADTSAVDFNVSQASQSASEPDLSSPFSELELWMIQITTGRRPDKVKLPQQLLNAAADYKVSLPAKLTRPELLTELAFTALPSFAATIDGVPTRINANRKAFVVSLKDLSPEWFSKLLRVYIGNELRAADVLNAEREDMLNRIDSVRSTLTGMQRATSSISALARVSVNLQMGRGVRPDSTLTTSLTTRGTQMFDSEKGKPTHLGEQMLAEPDEHLRLSICNTCGLGGSGFQRPCEAPLLDLSGMNKIVYPFGAAGRPWCPTGKALEEVKPGDEDGTRDAEGVHNCPTIEFDVPRVLIRPTPAEVRFAELERIQRRKTGPEGDLDEAPLAQSSRAHISFDTDPTPKSLNESIMETLSEIKSVLQTHLVSSQGSRTPSHTVSFSDADQVISIPSVGSKRLQSDVSGGPQKKRARRDEGASEVQVVGEGTVESTEKPQEEETETHDPFADVSDSEEVGPPSKKSRSGEALAISDEARRFLRPILFEHYRAVESKSVLDCLPLSNYVLDEKEKVPENLLGLFRREFLTIPVDNRLPEKFKGKSGRNYSRLNLQFMVLTTRHSTTMKSTGEVCKLDSYSVLQGIHNRAALTRISNIPQEWKDKMLEAGIQPPTKKDATVGLCHLCMSYKSNQMSTLRHLRRDHYSFGFMCALCGVMAHNPDDLFDVPCAKKYDSIADFLAKHEFERRDLGNYKNVKKFFP